MDNIFIYNVAKYSKNLKNTGRESFGNEITIARPSNAVFKQCIDEVIYFET